MVLSALSLCIGCLAGIATISSGFQPPPLHTPSICARESHLSSCASDVDDFLAANYPSCSYLLSKTGDSLKKIIKAEVGFTIFAPNEAAFADLGEKKREQLDDVRNDEVTEKIASYHVILEPVTADMLFNSGGVITEGGEVPTERSFSGGFFGVGGKEDGGVTLNGSKVVQSFEFADATITGIVHEVDGLISPSIMWRYADQLRIPGSQ
eukprot:CAMPEP_0172553948 /NCGR_PEP_ID=MMETSP1067-20121228/52494_1 /TAXON_ID=265564 ORGANISM="Thalassiosira punctigera, Strain Tpunct2005C2" /NCGR_SAMPLE_ID=MMETSP1067 /ASSEMBLY_ACC=CAM_ASM_000444 /LENGTH=208 /DNA_ID=CAMNT_0013342227 /DNA_START=56 /DNA_END=682 /DNA_ORIENTATION=+